MGLHYQRAPLPKGALTPLTPVKGRFNPILMGIICIRRLAPTIKILELNLKINQSHCEESNGYKQDEHWELSPRGD